nr:ferredoxin family protein [Candidatus Freyarchaeota archaeon]
MGEEENQETKKSVKAIHIDPKLCKGCELCGLCVYYCPRNVFEKSKKQNEQGYYPPIPINTKGCRGCKVCELYCPELAIFVEEES